MQAWTVNSDFSRDQFIENVEKLYQQHKYLTFTWTVGKKRSTSQNNALHLYLSHLSTALNDAGYDMKLVLQHKPEIQWTQASAKEYLWKPIQKALTEEESTTKPNTVAYIKIYDTLNKYMSENLGINVPWPMEKRDD